jgi:hypothetical protein
MGEKNDLALYRAPHCSLAMPSLFTDPAGWTPRLVFLFKGALKRLTDPIENHQDFRPFVL